MRTITATTAFKMPLYGIGLPLYAFQGSSEVFRNTEKLSCVNDNTSDATQCQEHPVEDALRFYAASGVERTVTYAEQAHPAPGDDVPTPNKSKQARQIFCALINCINPILQPQSPAKDYRGFFIYKSFYSK